MRAHRFDAMTAREPAFFRDRIDEREPRARPMHHRRRDRMIERDHRIVGKPQQHAVERENLRPVSVLGARGFVVQRRDRSLDLVRADAAFRQRRGDERATIKKVRVVRADTDRNLLLVKGSLPGARGSLILVKKA